MPPVRWSEQPSVKHDFEQHESQNCRGKENPGVLSKPPAGRLENLGLLQNAHDPHRQGARHATQHRVDHYPLQAHRAGVRVRPWSIVERTRARPVRAVNRPLALRVPPKPDTGACPTGVAQ